MLIDTVVISFAIMIALLFSFIVMGIMIVLGADEEDNQDDKPFTQDKDAL